MPRRRGPENMSEQEASSSAAPQAAMDDLPAPRPLDPDRDAVFLDFDGTLVELAATADAIRVAPYLRALLQELQGRVGGALALVSGRPAAEIDHFLAPLRLAAATKHGRERRLADGTRLSLAESVPIDDEARRTLDDAVGHWPGARIEDKGDGLAVHFRAVPEAEAAIREATEAVVAASAGALDLLPGKMVLELVPAGEDKGTGITALLDHPPFKGRVPVFAGDDVTDEAGFGAVLRRDGLAVVVGERRPTAARAALPGVMECHRWLAGSLDLSIEEA